MESSERGDHGPIVFLPQADHGEGIMFGLKHNNIFKVLLFLTREHNFGTNSAGLSFLRHV